MSKVTREDCVTDEMCPPFEAGAGTQTNSGEIENFNDAEIRGKEHPDMLIRIAQPFVSMTGQVYPKNERRNTKRGNWKRVELPLGTWLHGWEKGTELPNGTIAGLDFGLTRLKRTNKKGGDMIVLADAINGAKTEGAIKTLYAIGLDVDSNTELSFALDALEANNLFALVYPTFRHMTTELELDHDKIVDKLSLDASPTIEDVKRFMREHHITRYSDDFIDAVEITETCRQTSEKQVTILKTLPQHKFRIFLFL